MQQAQQSMLFIDSTLEDREDSSAEMLLLSFAVSSFQRRSCKLMMQQAADEQR
jgi:hypothetical protein